MSYTKNTWSNGDVITASKINNIENGIEDLSNTLDNVVSFDMGDRLAKGVDDEGNVIESAVIEGVVSGQYANKATAKYTHAEGIKTVAEEPASHAEGTLTKARGASSHAEGNSTIAIGDCSHAEGAITKAQGHFSHAEGSGTIANGKSEHVFGEFNVESIAHNGNRSDYVEVVGNGTDDNARSNARTLDWSGNESLAGNITLGKGSQDEVTITPQKITQFETDISGLQDSVDEINDRIDNIVDVDIPSDYQELVGDVSQLKNDLSDMNTATASDVGKALKAKTVSGGKVTEWEFGEAGGGSQWSNLAIDIFDSIGSEIAFTNPTAGVKWNNLISALKGELVAKDVTINGKHFDKDNNATYAVVGGSYSCTFSPQTGYLISGVTASMGNEAITPVDNGDGTYTVSVADVTDSITISVATYGDPATIMYHAENLVCDGTQSPIETPLQFSSASANGVVNDWTLCVRATGASNIGNYKYVFATANNPTRLGWDSYVNTSTRVKLVGTDDYNKTPTIKGNSVAMIVTHIAGDTKKLNYHCIDKTTGEILSVEKVSGNGVNDLNYANNQTPLLIGSQTDTSCAFVGTIEDVTIYNRLLDADEINEYLTGGEA